MVDTSLTPRGIRDNNPGNIRRSVPLIPWKGLAAIQSDPEFLVFADAVHGLRAIARILLHYQVEGVVTVRTIITHWAPPDDPTQKIQNDTEAYITDVAGQLGVGALVALDLANSPLQLRQFVEAIVRHENGQQPYTVDQLASGVTLARAA